MKSRSAIREALAAFIYTSAELGSIFSRPWDFCPNRNYLVFFGHSESRG